MSGKKNKASSSRFATPSKYTQIDSTKDPQHLANKGFKVEFNINSVVKDGPILRCNVGDTSFNGRPFTGIEYSNREEAEGCFEKLQKNDYDFAPIIAVDRGDKILVLGEDVGIKFDQWVLKNQGDVFDGSELTEVGITIGKRIFEIVTKNHQKGEFLGNIKEGMYINNELQVIFIPCPEINNNISGFNDGLKKDLGDLRWVMEQFQTACTSNATMKADFSLFYHLFPNNLSLQEDENKLKTISYIICHNPLFWEFHERFFFFDIANELYDERKDGDDELFTRLVPINQNQTNVGHWQRKVQGLATTNVLRAVYDYGLKRNPRSYKDEKAIIPFIRNTAEHYHERDPSATLQDVDKLILSTFDNLHMKVYLAMASPNRENGVYLDFRLQKRGFNYNK